MRRVDDRTADALRPVKLTTGTMQYAEGSCLVEWGQTRVICTASVEERVPAWLKETGQGGWVTAEYAMLPRATKTRTERESVRRTPSGRPQEIQRLIGRSLRAVTRLSDLGSRTIIIDCDVLQGDGGTRCASVTGGFVALVGALRALRTRGAIATLPVTDYVAGVSMGLVGGLPVLDLNYEEDVRAGVDLNLVMTGGGRVVEIQGTAEGHPFSRQELDALLALGSRGITRLTELQRELLGPLSRD